MFYGSYDELLCSDIDKTMMFKNVLKQAQQNHQSDHMTKVDSLQEVRSEKSEFKHCLY